MITSSTNSGEELLPMGTRGVRPTSARGRLHRPLIPRSCALQRRFRRAGRRAQKYFYLSRAEERRRPIIFVMGFLLLAILISRKYAAKPRLFLSRRSPRRAPLQFLQEFQRFIVATPLEIVRQLRIDWLRKRRLQLFDLFRNGSQSGDVRVRIALAFFVVNDR
jgi:hypothetical protein